MRELRRLRRESGRWAGFTLLETVVAIGITSTVMFAALTLQRDIFTLNGVLRTSFGAQMEVRKALKSMSAELRVAQYADTGAYPVTQAATAAITFYADANANGSPERIRYYVSGTTLKRGVIHATGSPATYVAGNEVITNVVKDLSMGATSIFTYYDETYTGTSSALAQPVTTSDVRLVKITLIVDPNSVKPPAAQTYSTQIQLRNLKDNL